MLGHRDLSVDEYLQILRRRLWWILIPAVLAPVVAVGVSLRLPNRFTSQTLVLVERQKVPDSYVTPVVSEVLNARLATMQEQILSRTRLQPVIDRFSLFQEIPNAAMEEKVDLMRRSVSVKPVRGDFGFGSGAGLPGFYISFTASDPRLAQQVCGEITSMFMQENLKLREASAQGTTDFIKSQLEDAKRGLDEQDARLATFKQKYIGQLPGSEQANFNMLTSLTSQLDANTQALARLQQEKTYTESMLSQQVQQWQTLQSSRSDPGTPRFSPDAFQQALLAAQGHVMALQQKYTDTHPDVVKAKKDVATLQKRVDESNAAESNAAQASPRNRVTPEVRGGEPAGVQQLRTQLHGMELSIRDKERAQAELQRQIKTFESRIQLSPVVEEKHKQLTRDYQTALDFYNQLLNKKNQSEMATDLERRQQGEQFRVLDPPNLPEKPTFPNRRLFAAGGFGGGLALGLVIALLLEYRDKSIRSEQDVQFYLELPTLALMPTVEIDPAHMRDGNWRKRARLKSAPRESVGA